MTEPTPILRTDPTLLTGLIGVQLAGVTYHYLPPVDDPGYVGGGDGFDAELSAIRLDLADRGPGVVVTWAMSGELEGLAILSDAALYPSVADETVDASDREGWRSYRGDTIRSVGAAWHVSAVNCPDSLWALRLDFATGSIVIALGTNRPDLDYMPDELVAVFDQSLADSYRPRHISGSSWGHRIEPA